MPTITKRFRTVRLLDARPDRIDLRDREYAPRLTSLPAACPDPRSLATFLKSYPQELILDQGSQGACTGFGLAAVINSLRFRLHGAGAVQPVSPRMLYHLARLYDEWAGEDYEGSSCRGAMKGWHRHGVCLESTWPYRDAAGRVRFRRPADGWQHEAAQVPLGAYYRINKDSVADMQSAVHEVGAIYVSADVHDGWDLRRSSALPTITIPQPPGETGGHAFAIVGYNARGFIVQNSWGTAWGFRGFAIMTYRDWVEHGTDAWVAVLGAPVELPGAGAGSAAAGAEPARTKRSRRLQDLAGPARAVRDARASPLGEGAAYEHTVVLGNNGRPLNVFLDAPSAAEAVTEAVHRLPLQRLSGARSPRVLVYAHGGLNDEAASIRRVRVMAPYFLANGIYPLFITWRTGFFESLRGMLEDALSTGGAEQAGSLLDRLADYVDRTRNRLREAIDRTIELACERLLIKPLWLQMKQNAAAAEHAGLALLARRLRGLVDEVGALEIHLAGHSAGSLVLGHLLNCLARQRLDVASCSLYAPACTLRFALDHYGPRSRAVGPRGIIRPRDLAFGILTDERERQDSVGPYGKSLLYLVSRALESVHKTPLLGMEAAWREVGRSDLWCDDTGRGDNRDVAQWRRYARSLKPPEWLGAPEVSDGEGTIPAAHGSFDNDVAVMGGLIRRIRQGPLLVEVESLRGF